MAGTASPAKVISYVLRDITLRSGWSNDTVIPPSMRAAVALVVTFIGWDRFSPGQHVPPCGPRDGATNRGSTGRQGRRATEHGG